METSLPKIAFFGTPHIAVEILLALEASGILPTVIITNPDAPKGRKLTLTPSPVKVWATERGIHVLEPTSLKGGSGADVETHLKEHAIELCVVAAYGKIIPQSLLDIPKYGTLNVHPSLLPLLRGASPIRSAILADMRTTGVTIMRMDAELDHGDILAQEEVTIDASEWPMHGRALDELLAKKGGSLLAAVIPKWTRGEIQPKPQEHEQATFSTKISKEMGEVDLAADPCQNLLKIRAFDGWPGTYFFVPRDGKQVRVKIVDATLGTDSTLVILRVIPEGKSEMAYTDFLRSF